MFEPCPVDPAFTVLLVCTGNICRSALAERLGREYVERALGGDSDVLRLTSAGTHAVAGSAMHPHSADALRALGGDPEPFRARRFQPEQAREADLVLTMTREHRRLVLEAAPGALRRTFTLREAADLVGLLDGVEPPGGGLAERARALVAAMAAARPRRTGQEDDVPDPIDGPADAHREAGELIAAALTAVLARLVALRAADRPGNELPERESA